MSKSNPYNRTPTPLAWFLPRTSEAPQLWPLTSEDEQLTHSWRIKPDETLCRCFQPLFSSPASLLQRFTGTGEVYAPRDHFLRRTFSCRKKFVNLSSCTSWDLKTSSSILLLDSTDEAAIQTTIMFQVFLVASCSSCPALMALVSALFTPLAASRGPSAAPAANYGVRDDRWGLITDGACQNILSLSPLMMLDPWRGEAALATSNVWESRG